MRVVVAGYATERPNDVEGLKRALDAIPIEQVHRLALVAKTEGTATINDFSRELALTAAQGAIHAAGGDDLFDRSTLIFSTGCEGVLSPCVYVLAALDDGPASDHGPPRLAIGGARTRAMTTEELITPMHARLRTEHRTGIAGFRQEPDSDPPSGGCHGQCGHRGTRGIERTIARRGCPRGCPGAGRDRRE